MTSKPRVLCYPMHLVGEAGLVEEGGDGLKTWAPARLRDALNDRPRSWTSSSLPGILA